MAMMEVEINSETPPVSPMYGLGECLDSDTLEEIGPVMGFTCKGSGRSAEFSSDGLLRRNAVLNQIRLKFYSKEETSQNQKLVLVFGHWLDPLETGQVEKFLDVCSKNILVLEAASEYSSSFSFNQRYDSSDDPKRSPWELRKAVLRFLNEIIRRVGFYQRSLGAGKLQDIFGKLKTRLLPVKEWSPVLKNHCGAKSDNAEITSATFHFFHVQLEARWSLFVLYGGNENIRKWLMEELIELAFYKYSAIGHNESLIDNQPFQCLCVRELWTMLKLMVENLEHEGVQQKLFWNLYSLIMQQYSSPHFRIWLTSNLCPIGDYAQDGNYTAGQAKSESTDYGNNAIKLVQDSVKDWRDKGGRSQEMLKLSLNFFQYWGGNIEIITPFWTKWSDSINKNDLQVLDSYNSVEPWLKFIFKIKDYAVSRGCRSNLAEGTPSKPFQVNEDPPLGSNNDKFMEFVSMVTTFSETALTKDINRLKSSLSVKLKVPESLNEAGIIRVSTLFLAIASAVKSDKDAIGVVVRLHDLLSLDKGNRSFSRKKVKFRSYAVSILLLLNRNIPARPEYIASFCKAVDEHLSSSPHEDMGLETSRKDLIMVYIDLLSNIPKNTPVLSSEDSLGRDMLISPNLGMWISAAHKSYAVRTCTTLVQITGWIIAWIRNLYTHDNTGNCEGKQIYQKISERVNSYLWSAAVLNSSKNQGTDVENAASLAADLSLLSKLFSKSYVELEARFDQIALSVSTSPVVGQHYLNRLFVFKDTFVGSFPEKKLIQAWVRHVVFNCSVPDTLTDLVLDNFQSTSYTDLVKEFCKRVTKPVDICYIEPIFNLVKWATTASNCNKDTEPMIASIVTSATLMLTNISSELVYFKGGESVMSRLLNDLLKAPIATYAQGPPGIISALENNLYDLFLVVVSRPNLTQDPYLVRKLQEILVLAFIGFPNAKVSAEYPPLKIYKYCEDNRVDLVLKKLIPENVCTGEPVTEAKSSFSFITTVNHIRTRSIAALVIRLLPGVLRCYLFSPKDRQNIRDQCGAPIIYSCLIASGPNQQLKDLATRGFGEVLEKEFATKGKLILSLLSSIARSKNAVNGRLDARLFLSQQIVPIVEMLIERAEMQRASGRDKSLREPFEQLQTLLRPVTT